MSDIFISYRRSDSENLADRLYHELASKYGGQRVFKDVNTIPLGTNFPGYIASQLKECKVFVLLISKTFISCRNKRNELRLFDEQDYLRLEIETAIKLKVPIIPILDKDVIYPANGDLPESIRSIIYINALQMGGANYFKYDISKLISRIDEIIPTTEQKPGPASGKRIFYIIALLLVVSIAVAGFLLLHKENSGKNFLQIRIAVKGLQKDSLKDNFSLGLQNKNNTSYFPLHISGVNIYSDISNIPASIKGDSFRILLNESLSTSYSLNTNGDPYLYADTTYEISLLPKSVILPHQDSPVMPKPKPTGPTINNLPPAINETENANDLGTSDCLLSGKFIDAKTFDDYLVFSNIGKNRLSYTGAVAHRPDEVSGEAIQKGNVLILKGDLDGRLSINNCKELNGKVKVTSQSLITATIYFKQQ